MNNLACWQCYSKDQGLIKVSKTHLQGITNVCCGTTNLAVPLSYAASAAQPYSLSSSEQFISVWVDRVGLRGCMQGRRPSEIRVRVLYLLYVTASSKTAVVKDAS